MDVSAMQEAMRAAREDVHAFSSSASYAHFLRSRVLHFQGRHSEAATELELALATDLDNPLLMTALAEEHARLSNLEKAEKVLRQVLERHPRHAAAQLLMGRVLLESRKYTRGRIHLRRALQLSPRNAEAYLVLAQLELELNRPDAAMRLAEDLARAVPGEPIAYKRLGLAFAERGDAPRAQKMLEEAAKRDVGDFEVQVTLAQVYESQNRLAEAESAYGKALMRDPENLDALLAAGRLALRDSSLVRARAYFRQLQALTDDPEVTVRVAFAYLAARQLDAAAEVLDHARLQGREPRLAFYAGLVHEKRKKPLKAAQAYGEVPGESDLFHEARVRQASCYSLAGQHGKAFELFKRGLSEKPDLLLLYPAYARALERGERFREAEGLLLAAIDRFGEAELVDALSSGYQRQGRTGDAITLLQREIAKRPNDETLRFSLGAAFERQGDIPSSMQQMRELLALNPEHAAALNFIGYTLADRGESLDEAEGFVLRALALKPESGAFLDSLGWLYYRRGQFDRAVDTLERATALAPGEPIIIEHLGDAYRRVDRVRDAVEAYRRALEALREAAEPEEFRAQRQSIEKKLKALSTETSNR